jgi:hypothetical protein
MKILRLLFLGMCITAMVIWIAGNMFFAGPVISIENQSSIEIESNTHHWRRLRRAKRAVGAW